MVFDAVCSVVPTPGVDALPENAVGKTPEHELRAGLGSMFLPPARGGADGATSVSPIDPAAYTR